jgi:hypothetical protein
MTLPILKWEDYILSHFHDFRAPLLIEVMLPVRENLILGALVYGTDL